MKKRNFSAEFKRESAQLVIDQNYTVAKATADVRLSERLSLIRKLRARYPMVTLCHMFRVHHNSYKYWKCRPDEPDRRRTELRSQIQELHNISHGSAGA
ncbi:MAG: IS3 family transposase, partial [Symbiopectobacterium sp.]